MLSKDDVIKQLRKICTNYTDILGLVILFGSFSRGEATASSDIDLYVEPKESNTTTMKFGNNKRFKEFKYSLYDNLPFDFDILSYGGKRDLAAVRRSSLWGQIEKDGVLIYEQRG